MIRVVLHGDLVDTGFLESHDKVQSRHRTCFFGHHGVANSNADIVIVLDRPEPLEGGINDTRTLDTVGAIDPQLQVFVAFIDAIDVSADRNRQFGHARQENLDSLNVFVVVPGLRLPLLRRVIDPNRLLTLPIDGNFEDQVLTFGNRQHRCNGDVDRVIVQDVDRRLSRSAENNIAALDTVWISQLEDENLSTLVPLIVQHADTYR